MRLVSVVVRWTLIAGLVAWPGCQTMRGTQTAAEKKPAEENAASDRALLSSFRSNFDNSNKSGSSKSSGSGQMMGLSDTSRDIERSLGYR